MEDDKTASGHDRKTSPTGAADDGWPEGIRRLAAEELSSLGIDVNKRLYINGQPVGLAQTLVLTTAQKVWAVALSAGAFLAFLATFAQGWAAGFLWMCQVGWIHTWCPAG